MHGPRVCERLIDACTRATKRPGGWAEDIGVAHVEGRVVTTPAQPWDHPGLGTGSGGLPSSLYIVHIRLGGFELRGSALASSFPSDSHPL